jgi:hypothetical protein
MKAVSFISLFGDYLDNSILAYFGQATVESVEATLSDRSVTMVVSFGAPVDTAVIRRAQDELKAAKKTLEKRYAALEKAKKEESEMAEFSESVLQMIEHVVDITFEDLTKARDKNKELYYASRGDDDKAYKMYKRLSEFDRKLMWMSDDEILNYSKIAGKEFALDLINRTKAIVGNVTNWEHLHYGVAGLDGIVYGDKGKASVNTIVAGGYNIQRRHYRVLVKAIK